MHTENSHLSQIITTFSTGLTALNGLTAQVQNFATGTSGSDFNISSVTDTHTFNLPTASASNRGALSSTDWSTFNGKQNTITLTTTGSSGVSTFNSATGALNIPEYTLSGLGGVPYTGATADVNLGTHDISAKYGYLQELYLYDTATPDLGFIYLNAETLYIKMNNADLLASIAPGRLNLLGYGPGGIYQRAIITYQTLTAGRTYALPNASGTIALTSDIPSLTGYVQTTRTISTTSPLQGGGDLSANRTLSILQSSGSQDGYLSSTDWSAFNGKQNAITLTVTGTSGAATLVGSTLNIPQYAVGIGGSGTTNYVPRFTSASTIGDSLIFDNGTNIGIGNTTPSTKLDVNGGIRGYGAGNTGRITSTDISVGGASITINPQLGTGIPGIETGGAFPIAFNTNSSERMRITSAGDLGINIATPSQKLHVAGNARITGAIYDSSNSAGTSGQVLSSTATGTAWVTGGGGGGITGSGTTNYVPKFTGSTAIGDSNISDNGTLVTIATDASVNGIKVGRGAGNVGSNTVVGASAFVANSSGINNTAIGDSAGRYITGSGNTFIGAGSSKDTLGNNFDGSNTLSIAKDSADYFGMPHFWAPDRIFVGNSSSSIILSLKSIVYSGFFLEYVIQEATSAGRMQSGTIKAIFVEDGSLISWSNDNILSIGDTSLITFNVYYDSGNGWIVLEAFNSIGGDIGISTTSRLILRKL
jgi:hypothetical protein